MLEHEGGEVRKASDERTRLLRALQFPELQGVLSSLALHLFRHHQQWLKGIGELNRIQHVSLPLHGSSMGIQQRSQVFQVSGRRDLDWTYDPVQEMFKARVIGPSQRLAQMVKSLVLLVKHQGAVLQQRESPRV